MSKALKTIEKHIKDLERMEDVFSFYGCFSSAAECKKASKELKQAISELEAQEDKSCEWCKHNYDIENFDIVDGKRLDSFRPNECYVCSRNMNDRYEKA